jgi:ribosomal protein S18 acetylase RimI-like enzyme
MSNSEIPVRIRPVSQVDVPFIFNSWLKSFRGAFFAKDIHPKTYYGEHHKIVASLLQTCTTYVACDDNDPTNIYGFVCGEYMDGAFVLHYIYVKHTFRNFGIATKLIQKFPIAAPGISFYTHHNAVSQKIAIAYNFLYSPYLAFLPEYRKNKPKNALDLNTKVKEDEDDEQDYKRRKQRGTSPSIAAPSAATEPSAGATESSD